MNPLLLTDGYKLSHHKMYPKDTTLVYTNGTPRSNKYAPKGIEKVVSFGQQAVMKTIDDLFEGFFNTKIRNIIKDMKSFSEELEGKELEEAKSSISFIESDLTVHKQKCFENLKQELELYTGNEYDISHFEALWELGYLPIEVKAIPEGECVPFGIPVITVKNTHPDFYWITNYLETIISNYIWKPMTSATIALEYKKLLLKYAKETDKDNVAFVDFQAHDFSMRGMDSIFAVQMSGLGHLTSFSGTDSLPTISAARDRYNHKGFLAGGVPASEHSVMSAHGKENEIETLRHIMKEYPTGPVSIVSDTWNLWDLITVYLPQLKNEILARDGKLVIRPDSGNPVDILCGEQVISRDYRDVVENASLDLTHPKYKGVVELLWDIFGGTINEQGYKVLDPHIGAIYGDSITLDRAEEICKRLKSKGFASTNIVLGIGSYTYQYNTRDTLGFAMKATYCEVKQPGLGWGHKCEKCFVRIPKECSCCPNCYPGYSVPIRGRDIFKDPVTDDGTKKSAKGLLQVEVSSKMAVNSIPEYTLRQGVTWEEEAGGALQTIYKDGEFFNETTFDEVRKRLSKYVN